MDGSLRNYCRKFGTPKSCLQDRNTSFASVYVSKVCKMLRKTPKHRFVSNGVEWMLSLRNYFRKFGTRNSAFTPETQVSDRFTCRRFANCFETLRNIMVGLVEQNGCFRCETIFESSVPQNRAFRPETQVLHRFRCQRLAKCFETLPNIVLGLVESNGCFCCKTIFGISVPEILRSRPKHKFRIVLRVEGLQNAPKDSQTSFCV